MSPELAALGAAMCWTAGGLISTLPARELGGIVFTRVRMTLVFAMLASVAMLTGGWASIELQHLSLLVLSGLIGILIGDSALFATLKRLGPRRMGILFACNAPFTAVLAWIFLDEIIAGRELLGMLLVVCGVFLSILYGRRRDTRSHWENTDGLLLAGIALGLLGALGQSLGTLIAKPVMAQGIDPVAASALRVGTAAFGLQLLRTLPRSPWRATARLSPKLLGLLTASGIVGMGLGMTLLLYALRHGDAGMVAVLSSTSPVLVLPLLWMTSRERPAAGAWLGAAVAVLGTALILWPEA
jgi:drug/metabolite transporter (DMT)-like permease